MKAINQKMLAATLLVPLLTLSGLNVEAGEEELNFCQRQFGKSARIRFEPDKSNQIGVADAFDGSGSFRYKKPDVPKPERFRCIVTPLNGSEGSGKAKCPSNLRAEKIGRRRWCGSRSFDLKKLCPDGLKHTWPELEPTVCSKE